MTVDSCQADHSRIRILVSVHRAAGHGLTQEVESLLRYNPLRWFALADVMDCIRRNAARNEVNAVLHKLVHDKGLAQRERVLMPNRIGSVRLIARYKWRV